ncbi:MAG: hypothetical protein IJA02_09005 [Clostridia bacterium]|nr:hypothetical protein [Clostridia bacterium]
MNKATLDIIWDKLVIPTYNHMQFKVGGLICPECGKDELHEHYEDIVKYAKKHYMFDENGVLNRHKIAAALMIAILKTKPIKKINAAYYQEDINGKMIHWPFNESLAITVGLSVLRAFIIARVDYAFSGKLISKQIFEDVTEEDTKIFSDGIPISEQERAEWEWELYQIRLDGSYNLLAIAHILKEIEKNCKLEYFWSTKKTPTYPDPTNLTEDAIELISLDEIMQ